MERSRRGGDDRNREQEQEHAGTAHVHQCSRYRFPGETWGAGVETQKNKKNFVPR